MSSSSGFTSALPANIPKFQVTDQVIEPIRRSLDAVSGAEYATLLTRGLDVAFGREHATLLIKTLADVAVSYDTYALVRRHVDYGDGYDVHRRKLGREHGDCVVTNAVYGGLRICYKTEGDLLDFETLWYIFLTLRRIDEFIQEIAQIDIWTW